ncbi:AAA family ATPase [Candidatus Dojkabacteria bacterium]|jgi:cell division protease FtsH|nr:AAA family ATPase [Candidatus Dojkabacteria bacterium]
MDLESINKKKEILESVRILLKEKFIGIDEIIDKIINGISLWYIIPEYQLRPLIINLWGITGVGKTDLVRTLIKLLNLNDKFVEIQLDMKDNYSLNIQSYLELSDIEPDEQCVLLLDEMQRFRSIDETGKLIESKYFNDIWMLLSDGKFQNDNKRKRDLIEMYFDELYWKESEKKLKTPDTEKTEDSNTDSEIEKKYKMTYWSASRLKKLIKTKYTAEEIMTLSSDEKLEVIKTALCDKSTSEGKTYSKMLIFISGNLDEAYHMASDVDDCERDADIYNELSKRITILDIKEALLKKFKPEQISRFGNNHIIYPILNKENYYSIIKKYCNQILDNIYIKNKIKINLTDNIYDIIYKNGVFPAQGVRPVISTISNIIESNIPYFLFICLEHNKNKILIDFDNTTSNLFCKLDKTRYNKKITLDIDNIKKNKSLDEKMLVLVHELGHALVYTLLFKTTPKQININAAGFSNGFVINHSSVDNKTFLKNRICVLLAGIVAEEFIYGDDYKSNGSQSDILNATHIASQYIRKFAMNGTISYIFPKNQNIGYDGYFNTNKSDKEIEHILRDEKIKCEDLLKTNINIFKALINYTIENNKIEIEDFINICL